MVKSTYGRLYSLFEQQNNILFYLEGAKKKIPKKILDQRYL